MKDIILHALLLAFSVSLVQSQDVKVPATTEAPSIKRGVPAQTPKTALLPNPADNDTCCLPDAMTKSLTALAHQKTVNTIFGSAVTTKDPGPWRSFSAQSKKDIQTLQVQLFEAEEKGGLEGVFTLVSAMLKDGKNHPDMVKHAFATHITHSAKARQYLTVPDLKHWSFFKRFQAARNAPAPMPKTPVNTNDALVQLVKPITADTFVGEEILAYWRDDYDYQDHHLHWHVVYPGAGIYMGNGSSVPVIDRQGELFLYMHSQMVSRYDCERISWGMPVTATFDFDDVVSSEYYPVPGLIPFYGARPGNKGWYELNNPNVPADVASPPKAALKKWRDNVYAAISNKSFGTVSVADSNTKGTVTLTEDNAQHITGVVIEAESDPLSTFNKYKINRDLYGDIHDLGHDKFAEIGYKTFLSSENQMGLMTSNYGSPRDPVFYEFHRHIETYRTRVGDQFPLDLNEHKPEAIIRALRIDPKGGTTLGTPIGQGVSTVLGAPRLDLLESNAKINHEPFIWTFHITSTRKIPPSEENPQIVTARIFICPEELVQQRSFWVEMDKFTIKLTKPRTIVSRQDIESSVARKPVGANASDWCKCGWPQNMLLPAGRPSGMPTIAFCMLTDDKLNMDSLKSNAVAFCGANVPIKYPGTYPDPRGAGYPFDRVWVQELQSAVKSKLEILAMFPNIATYKFNIYRTTQYYAPQASVQPAKKVTWDIVQPYFTKTDVECMLGEYTFDFSKYSVVKIHSGMIYDAMVHKRMPKQMPPFSPQKPNPDTPYWTDEQLSNFKYWMQSGCPEK